MRNFVLIALLLIVAANANAQRMGSPGGWQAFHGGRSSGAAHQRSGFFPLGLFPNYDEGPAADSGPFIPTHPLGIVQPSPVIPDRPPQPLMIELQGDRYVSVDSNDGSGMRVIEEKTLGENTIKPNSGDKISSIAPKSTAQTQIQIDPVVLIFRDGRREEVSDYTIADGTLYAHTDFYVDGSWNKKIALSSLNLPDTIDANRSRGINFQLPQAPNEIIVRP